MNSAMTLPSVHTKETRRSTPVRLRVDISIENVTLFRPFSSSSSSFHSVLKVVFFISCENNKNNSG